MVSDSAWDTRQTFDISLKELASRENSNLEILDYSMLRLNVPWQVRPLDVGAWSFTQRKPMHPNSNSADDSVWLVVTTTKRHERSASIMRYVEFLIYKSNTGTRSSTLLRYTDIFSRFLNWCDSGHNTNVLASLDTARESFAQYIHFLTEQVRSNCLHVNTAARYQNGTKEVLSFIFDDDQGVLTAGLRLIRKSTVASNVTLPPSQSAVRSAIDLYLAIFNQVTDFVLAFNPYPFQLNLPDEALWVFPTTKPMASSVTLRSRDTWKKGFRAWDYINGCISTSDKIESYYGGNCNQKRSSAKLTIKFANKVLRKANQDQQHYFRRRLAYFAADSFVMLFISNTGINVAQLQQLKWSDDYEIGKEHHGFRTIKYRANQETQQFVITRTFLPLFVKYLSLRQYLISDQPTYLFFRLDTNLSNPVCLSSGFSFDFNRKLINGIGINAPSITAREWRAHKADWLLEHTDPATTAMMLQNSQQTVLKHYSEGSEVESAKEMSDFFDRLGKIQAPSLQSNTNYEVIPAGHCEQYSSPKSDGTSTSVLPNCSTAAGCLFCTHHRVITDEIDIRKLWSLRFLIRESRQLANNEAHFQQQFGSVLERIVAIVASIEDHSESLKTLVEKIRREVDEEEILDPYWAHKYRLLITLEVLQ